MTAADGEQCRTPSAGIHLPLHSAGIYPYETDSTLGASNLVCSESDSVAPPNGHRHRDTRGHLPRQRQASGPAELQERLHLLPVGQERHFSAPLEVRPKLSAQASFGACFA